MRIMVRFRALFQERVDHPDFTESPHYVRSILTLSGFTGTPFPVDSYFPADAVPGTPRSPPVSFIYPCLMALSDSFWAAFNWLRSLGRNLYFWGGFAIIVGILFGGYLVVDSLVMPSYTRHEVSIEVPNVENQPYEQAKTVLEQHDLEVQREEGRYNPNVDQNVVVDQTPLPNAKVKPGRRVYLTVNAGEVPRVRIPDLKGMSVREAKNRVSSVGLTVGAVRQDSIPSPYANTITKQRPQPGDSLRQGQSVHLWYSTGLGETTVEIPDVVGRSVAEARQMLLSRNLRSVLIDDAESEEETSGLSEGEAPPESELYVREQGRSPGTSVQAGTEIRLFTTPDQEEAVQQNDSDPDTTANAEGDEAR